MKPEQITPILEQTEQKVEKKRGKLWFFIIFAVVFVVLLLLTLFGVIKPLIGVIILSVLAVLFVILLFTVIIKAKDSDVNKEKIRMTSTQVEDFLRYYLKTRKGIEPGEMKTTFHNLGLNPTTPFALTKTKDDLDEYSRDVWCIMNVERLPPDVAILINDQNLNAKAFAREVKECMQEMAERPQVSLIRSLRNYSPMTGMMQESEEKIPQEVIDREQEIKKEKGESIMATVGTAITILMILLLIALVIIIVLVILYFKSKKKLPMNCNIGFSLVPEYTDGHSVFLETDVKPMAKGRMLSTLIPKDIKQKGEDEDKEPPKPLYLVSAPGRRMVIATGDGSSAFRNVLLFLPPRPEKLSRGVQESILGKALNDTLNYENLVAVTNDRVAKIRETISKSAIAGEDTVNRIVLENLQDISEAIMGLTKKDDKSKKDLGGGYNPFGSPSPGF